MTKVQEHSLSSYIQARSLRIRLAENKIAERHAELFAHQRDHFRMYALAMTFVMLAPFTAIWMLGFGALLFVAGLILFIATLQFDAVVDHLIHRRRCEAYRQVDEKYPSWKDTLDRHRGTAARFESFSSDTI